MSIPSFLVLFYLLGYLGLSYKNIHIKYDGSLYEVDDFGEGSYIQWKTSFYPL
jgi:peptide/nickel transport system permease protein